jgi:acyl-CoA hydrolase
MVLVMPLNFSVIDGYASSCGMSAKIVEAAEGVVVEVQVAVIV